VDVCLCVVPVPSLNVDCQNITKNKLDIEILKSGYKNSTFFVGFEVLAQQ
jgi:hypothetical protein